MQSEKNKSKNKIRFWNRKTHQLEIENVYGDSALRLGYTTALGQFLMNTLFSRIWVSRLYGAFQSSFLSLFKIQPFIEKFNIPIHEYEADHFKSFNDFFIRKFKPGMREFGNDEKIFPAFSEARYFAFERVTTEDKFLVKGITLTSLGILGQQGSEYAAEFEGGPLLIARLCPTDYHRFHFPDDGKVVSNYSVKGILHSVNPVALRYKPDIFLKNERQVTILDTQNFGKLAYIEVGAMCVGKIVQTYFHSKALAGRGIHFKRGDEKGYFLFGGSTVIVMGQPGKWKPNSDLLEQTQSGYETYIQLGEQVGKAL